MVGMYSLPNESPASARKFEIVVFPDFLLIKIKFFVNY